MAKHCKLYLKILLTFLVPSIFLSFRLIKRAGRKKRSEWWHQHRLLPSTQTRWTHVDSNEGKWRREFPDSWPVSSLYSRCWSLCTFFPSAFARVNFSLACWRISTSLGNSSTIMNSNTFKIRPQRSTRERWYVKISVETCQIFSWMGVCYSSVHGLGKWFAKFRTG